MSIDLNWETITSGPDGDVLANRIRDFVHAKFQAVKLPRFIKSVTVHDFDFGTIPPQLELKDITDPLPDFYEDNEDYDDDEDQDGQGDDEGDDVRSVGGTGTPGKRRQQELRREMAAAAAGPSRSQTGSPMRPGPGMATPGDLTSPFLGVSTPGFLGGASNLHYFQSRHLGQSWSGTQTPLAAVAGAHMAGNGWLDHGSGASSPFYPPSPFGREGPLGGSPSHSRNPSQSSISVGEFDSALASSTPSQQQQSQWLREKSSVSTLAPTSVSTSRPPTRDPSNLAAAVAASGSAIEEEDELQGPDTGDQHGEDQPRYREPRPDDMQAVFRIRYAGDVKLRLTAEILLDYPMPSFVGIPVQLSVTGLTFDGVGVLAHIRKRLHFCFLSPEDALTAVGLPPEDEEEAKKQDQHGGEGSSKKRFGGLLQEIQVESEIGLREGGKQSLKNVGKVERFVLEQVRRIFEDEFVYPSFWTFLV